MISGVELPLLLDSHVFLWSITDDSKLTPKIHQFIDEEDLVYVSVASLWELIVKVQIGKLVFPLKILDTLEDDGFKILPIRIEHLKNYAELPNFHRDPFDKMIIAQARHEQLLLVTADKNIMRYDVKFYEVKKA